ncbi:MAG: GNAT family N-acetyltransferase [Nitrospiraceae bacterium]|nr:GNAT family N-acetyltransferase [Nitrospiraceae bacterium]
MSEPLPEIPASPVSGLRSVDLTTGLWPEVVGKFIETMPFEDRQAFGAGPSLVMELASGRLGRFEGLYDPGRAALLGMVGGWVLDYEAEIHLLYIRSSDRRRGFGRKLLSSFLENLDAAGVRASYLEVRESNRIARFLYYSLGFKLQGVRKNYYQNPTEDGLVMVREVTGDILAAPGETQQED